MKNKLESTVWNEAEQRYTKKVEKVVLEEPCPITLSDDYFLIVQGVKKVFVIKTDHRMRALEIYDDMKQIAKKTLLIRGIMIKNSKLVEEQG